jgi:hypothetical protein
MTIRWPEPPPAGLSDAMAAAGLHVEYNVGTQSWTASPDAATVQAFIDAYTPPPPPVPDRVTNFQARAVMIATPAPGGGTLYDAVDAAIQAGKNASAAGRLAWSAWEYANEVTRAGDLVAQLGAQLGLTEAQIDALFVAAAQIEA